MVQGIENLFSNFIQFAFKVTFFFLNFCNELIIMPFYRWLISIFPDLSSFFDTVDGFVNDYIFKGLAFFREVFLNCTGYPRVLLYILCVFLGYKVYFKIASIAVKFVLNGWALIQRGQTSTH